MTKVKKYINSVKTHQGKFDRIFFFLSVFNISIVKKIMKLKFVVSLFAVIRVKS